MKGSPNYNPFYYTDCFAYNKIDDICKKIIGYGQSRRKQDYN